MEVPVFPYLCSALGNLDERTGRYREHLTVGREGCRRETIKPASEIVFAQRKFLLGEHDKWFKNTGPGDVTIRVEIIERMRSQKVHRESQSSFVVVQGAERPVPYELAKAFGALTFVQPSDDIEIGSIWPIVQTRLPHEFRAIVEPAVP